MLVSVAVTVHDASAFRRLMMMVSVSVVIHSDVEHSAVYDCHGEQGVMIKWRIDSCSHGGMMSSSCEHVSWWYCQRIGAIDWLIGCSGSRWCVG